MPVFFHNSEPINRAKGLGLGTGSVAQGISHRTSPPLKKRELVFVWKLFKMFPIESENELWI